MKYIRLPICLLLCAMLFIMPAFATDAAETTAPSGGTPSYSGLLVLGDSISAGYGLLNYTPGGSPYECKSYGNLVAAELGLKGGETYINKAENGDKTGDLLALLPLVKGTVEKSPLILISIGGNDLLSLVTTVASAIAPAEITSYEQAAQILMNLTPEKLAALTSNKDVTAAMSGALLGFSMNFTQITKLLKSYNPDARVIFLAQYNPMANVPQVAQFNKFAAPLLTQLNVTMKTIAEAAGYEIADTPSVIDADSDILTNILSLDIHPNDAGHAAISKLVLGLLSTENNTPDSTAAPETTAAPDTTAAPETTAAPDTTAAPETTIAPETTAAPDTTAAPKDNGGCFSQISLAVIPLIAAFAWLTKKRR